MKRLSKAEAIAKFGEESVDAAMETYAEPTSRVMNPSFENPAHIGKAEYAGDPVKVDGWNLTAYYYLSPEDEENTDAFDWDGNVEFEAEEILISFCSYRSSYYFPINIYSCPALVGRS